MSSIIGRRELKVGQWIHFHTTKDLNKASDALQAIYQESQRYLVFAREDEMFDACRCYVMDINGNSFDYNARMYSLGSTSLVYKGEIRVVSKESVEAIHGAEKVEAVYLAAQKRIEELSDYFAKYPNQLLNTSNRKADQARQLNSALDESVAKTAGDISGILLIAQLAAKL